MSYVLSEKSVVSLSQSLRGYVTNFKGFVGENEIQLGMLPTSLADLLLKYTLAGLDYRSLVELEAWQIVDLYLFQGGPQGWSRGWKYHKFLTGTGRNVTPEKELEKTWPPWTTAARELGELFKLNQNNPRKRVVELVQKRVRLAENP